MNAANLWASHVEVQGRPGSVTATAMLMALGIVYLHFPGLICTAYTLAQQRVAGAGLVRAAPVAWVLLWGWALRRLAVARSAY